MEKKVSIKDIAKEASVSISTVSRVMGNYTNVPKETREKVMAAVKKLNYIPNFMAQSLAGGSMRNIGVVFTCRAESAFVDPFYSDVLRGIGSILQIKDYYMQLIAYDSFEAEKEACIKLLSNGRIDGVIILRSRIYDPLIYELTKNNYKFVLSGQVSDVYPITGNIFSVDTNNVEGCYEIVSHLAGQGHKKIAMITGNMDYVVDAERYKGYRSALLHADIDFDLDLVIKCDGDPREYKEIIKEKIKKRPDIEAIFARDDYRGVAAISAIKELGLKVPEDIAVAGYNDYHIATIVEPPLTTVRVDIFEMGRTLATQMLNIIENKEDTEKRIILPTELIIRTSSGAKSQQKNLKE